MIIKLFHFLSLFAYLNIIVYEAGACPTVDKQYIFAGDSIIEFLLDDVMDIPMKSHETDLEIPNEKYRVFQSGNFVAPITFFFFLIFVFSRICRTIKINHPFYQNKSVCLPGYYSYLFRLKPF